MNQFFGEYVKIARGVMEQLSLQEWSDIVMAEAAHRDRMEQHDYHTPGLTHSLRFAAGELGELDDLRLREDGRYKRNNGRDHLVLEEYGDALGMLATAWLAYRAHGRQDLGDGERHYTLRLSRLLMAMASVLEASVAEEAPGIDLEAELSQAAVQLVWFGRVIGLDPVAAHGASRAKQEARWAVS